MSESTEISLYEDMLQLHEQMLAAANSSAWDDLVGLEQRSSQLVARLASLPPRSLTPPQARQKETLIGQILALQENIRQEVAAWRQDVGLLLDALAGNGVGR